MLIWAGCLLVPRADALADEFLRGPHPFLRDNELSIHGGLAVQAGDSLSGAKTTLDYGFKIDGGLWLNLQAHDELVYVAPKVAVPVLKKIIAEEMAKRPSWALGLPLKAEVNSGSSYADAK